MISANCKRCETFRRRFSAGFGRQSEHFHKGAPFSRALSTPRNDLSRVSHDMIHFSGDSTGGLHPALSLWYNSPWRPFVVDVLILHHVIYHDCRRLCNIFPARHPPGGGPCASFPSVSSTDPSPFSLSLSTPRNDLSRVSHDMIHFSLVISPEQTLACSSLNMV